MRIDRKLLAAGMAASLVFVGSACGKVAEKATEKAIESQSGGDVDLDTDSGAVKYTDGDGNSTNVDVNGSGADLPEDWPADLAPPDAVRLTIANTQADGSMTAIGEADGTIDDYLDGLKSQVEAAGYEIDGDSSIAVDATDYAGFNATGADYKLTAALATSEAGKVSITLTLQPVG
jgi:hypothetical protein